MAAITDLVNKLAGQEDLRVFEGGTVNLRLGVVTAVSGATCSVKIGGDTIARDGIRYIGAPPPAAMVVLLQQGGFIVVLGSPTTTTPPGGAAGGVLSGSYPNPGFAVDMATQAELDAAVATIDAALAELDVDLTEISGAVPEFMAVNETYIVPTNKQVLFGRRIVMSAGARITLGADSTLIQTALGTSALTLGPILTAIATLTIGTESLIGFKTGAVQQFTLTDLAINLLANSTTAAMRSTLGLGGAAVLNVGVITGTVAAGDDSRFSAIGGGLPVYGDGSDGTVVLDGTVTVPWASKVGSVYTMTRDAFPGALTVNNTVTLITAGYKVFCQFTFDNEGTVHNSGANAIVNAAGAGGLAGTLAGGTAGAGASGASGNPGTASVNGIGAGGGAGGTGSSGAGGAGGVVASPAANLGRLHSLPLAALGALMGLGSTAIVWPQGGTGGGGGSGDIANVGGAGGGGGGLMVIFARIFTNNGTIRCRGGKGGVTSVGNVGGGGGGGGGYMILGYELLTGTGTQDCNGGALGTGFGTGTSGVVGGNGTVIQLAN